MANISSWEKLRKAVGLGYSEKLSTALAQEAADARRAQLALEKAKLEAQAKAAAEAAKALAEKSAARIEEVKAAAKPQVKKAVRDGDGDGFINDGTKNQKPAPKATAKKQAELKAKPKATPKPAAPKKKSGGKGTSTAQ